MVPEKLPSLKEGLKSTTPIPMQKSALFTPAVFRRAVDILRPGIEAQMEAGSLKRKIAVIAILDPVYALRAPTGHDSFVNKASLLDEANPVCYIETIGSMPESEWPFNFKDFVIEKLLLSLKTGMDSHLVRFDSPHLFQKGDFKYGGAAFFKHYLCSTSGLEWWQDLAISQAVMSIVHGLVIGEAQRELEAKAFFVA
jgi:hypothetical protein